MTLHMQAQLKAPVSDKGAALWCRPRLLQIKSEVLLWCMRMDEQSSCSAHRRQVMLAWSPGAGNLLCAEPECPKQQGRTISRQRVQQHREDTSTNMGCGGGGGGGGGDGQAFHRLGEVTIKASCAWLVCAYLLVARGAPLRDVHAFMLISDSCGISIDALGIIRLGTP